MGTQVFVSRHGAKNGHNVHFSIGEKVHYRTRAGAEYDIIIDSEQMKNGPYLGYEAIFPDGRFFAVDKGIIGWESK